MVSSSASTVEEYLASLPADRRAAIGRVRDVVNARLPPGYEETMQYGMISWIVPTSRLAATYNGQPLALASLASQKQYMALYLMTVYQGRLAAWFRDAYAASGKKLDMGKACVRFKTLDALPLDVVGEAIARVPVDAYVAVYEASRSQAGAPRAVAAAPSRPRAAQGAAGATRKARPGATRKARPGAKRTARTKARSSRR
jgi:hypothetical protein